MTDLNSLLDQVKSPEPSDLLKARIMQKAKSPRLSPNPQPANDNHWKRWTGVAAIAVVMGVVGLTTLTSAPLNEEEVWAEAAQDMGYGDLYAWVEGDASESLTVNEDS